MNKYYLEVNSPLHVIKEIEVIAEEVIAERSLVFYNIRFRPLKGFWNWIRRKKYKTEYVDVAIYPAQYTIVKHIDYDYELDEE